MTLKHQKRRSTDLAGAGTRAPSSCEDPRAHAAHAWAASGKRSLDRDLWPTQEGLSDLGSRLSQILRLPGQRCLPFEPRARREICM